MASPGSENQDTSHEHYTQSAAADLDMDDHDHNQQSQGSDSMDCTTESRRINHVDNWESKLEEPSLPLSSIPEEGGATDPSRGAGESAYAESTRNGTSNTHGNDACSDETAAANILMNRSPAETGLASTQNRTIQMTQKLFKTPREPAFETMDHERQVRQAKEKFHRDLAPNTTSPVAVQSSDENASPETTTDLNSILIDSENNSNPRNSDTEVEDRDAAAQFKLVERDFQKRKKLGKTEFRDEVHFRKAESLEKQRIKLRARKRALEEDEEAEEAERNARLGDINDNDEISDSEQLFFPDPEGEMTVVKSTERPRPSDKGQELRTKKPVKPRRNKISEGALLASVEAGMQPSKEMAAKQVSKRARLKSPVRRRGPSARKSKSTDGRATKTKENQHHAAKGISMTNLGSLLHNDIVGDAQAIQGREAQAVFAAKDRKVALAELIASVPEEQRKPHMQTRKALDDACKKFTWKGKGSMQADGGKWRLKGMKTSLLPHQLLGTAWMRERENASSRPFGGIIADSMGFGKTIMCLSNILDGQPTRSSPNRTTLIVCPSSLCTQWLTQIQTHVEPKLLGRTMLYRSGSRIVTDDNIDALTSCGVIITTYYEVMRSYPNITAPPHLASDEAKSRFWKEEYDQKRGALHRIFFRRIILDEATVIKNYKAKVSIACAGLMGKYRWVVSGTPIHNSIEEFYPYFKFAQVPHTGSFQTFKDNFCNRTNTSMQRLHSYLRMFMIRRTLSDEMLGRPILKLPPIDLQTVPVDFNRTERAIYQIVKNRFISKINEWSTQSQGSPIQKQLRSMWSLYLRLRQLCSHLLLLRNIIWELLAADDIGRLWRFTQRPAESSDDSETIGVLKKILEQPPHWIKKSQYDPTTRDQAEAPVEDAEQPARGRHGPSGDAGRFGTGLGNWQQSPTSGEISARSYCHKCRRFPEEPHITVPCEHIYCKECLTAMFLESYHTDRQRALCLACHNEFERTEPYAEYEQKSLGMDDLTSDRSLCKKGESSDLEVKESGCVDLADVSLHSAKTTAVKIQLFEWLAADQTTKVIVFTQFLDLIRILGRCCASEGWAWCELKGSMSHEQRDRSVQDFNKPEIRVMLASLKCGGLGLNLTMANKVILHDLWWNEAAEDQAWSRVYRIGQEKDVVIRRFCIRDSIDTNLLLMMQDRKNREIDWAIGADSQPDKVSLERLMELFGSVTIDQETGQPVVNADEDGGFIYVHDEHFDDDSDGEVRDEPPPRPF